METLNYKVLEGTGYNGYILKDAPVKVMQFGEGNFLRAFVDYFYDIANEKAGYNGKVKLVQPIGNFPQMADWINEQEGLYTLYLRGSEKGQKVDAKRVISCVSDCVCPYIDGKWDEVLALARSEDLETVVSNTTEAGIAYTKGDSQFDQVPPNSFPAKLTRVLFERYKAFNGAADKGLVILSCELIDNNGKELQKCCNNYAKDVFNGDLGYIREVDTEERTLKVDFDGKWVEYDVTELDELTLAYATTIHKAQGSEYPIVVMPVLMTHFVMLQRNLIYTGITRAKKICVLIGATKALACAIRNQAVLKRNTKLKERLNPALNT